MGRTTGEQHDLDDDTQERRALRAADTAGQDDRSTDDETQEAADDARAADTAAHDAHIDDVAGAVPMALCSGQRTTRR